MQPARQQRVGYGEMGWRLEGRIRSSRERGFHLGAIHPHSIRQLRTIDGNSIALHFGNAGDHQRGWERPRLARHIAHRGRPNTRLLEKLARDRFLDRFARFDESRKRGIAARRVIDPTPDQHLATMFGQHDDDRIDAREMLRPAVPAFPRPARAKDLARLAAYAAETMRSEEHTSELQSLMRISYAGFCLK